MERWTRVSWTRAHLVVRQLARPVGVEPGGDERPESLFDRLRASGLRQEAIIYVGQALPGFEVAAWALTSLRSPPPPVALRDSDAAALEAAESWLRGPTEAARRAAQSAAATASRRSPERLAALAVFHSGGSISPPQAPPIRARADSAGRFASAAVIAHAWRTRDPGAAMDVALDAADAIAIGGVRPPQTRRPADDPSGASTTDAPASGSSRL